MRTKRVRAGACLWCDAVLYHATRERPNRRWHMGSGSKAICYDCALKIAAFVLDSMQLQNTRGVNIDEALDTIAKLKAEIASMHERPLAVVGNRGSYPLGYKDDGF